MAKIKLNKKYKCAGDIFRKLFDIGFGIETATAFLNEVADADVEENKDCKTLHKLSQPKCPNDYRCPDCVYHQYIFDGIEFKGIHCDIDAK